MYSKRIIALFLFVCFTVVGQQKITIDEIYNGTFRTQGMDELQSLKNTNQYTVLNVNRQSRSMSIDLYDFATLKKVNTLIDTKSFSALANGINSYKFDDSEKMILLACNTKQIL